MGIAGAGNRVEIVGKMKIFRQDDWCEIALRYTMIATAKFSNNFRHNLGFCNHMILQMM